MITAVDTNILLDILGPDPVFGPGSADAIRSSMAQGRLIACEIVWTELAANFSSPDAAAAVMRRLGLEFSAASAETAFEAGAQWAAYRRRGGSMSRVTADFLIGAHALCQADRLLTRDWGFYHTYFKKLRVLDPSARARR